MCHGPGARPGNDQTMNSPFLTVQELAPLLRVPVSRVYDWTRQVGPDPIPAYRGGKRLLFDRDEVLAWFKRTQATAGRLVARARRLPPRIRRRPPHRGQTAPVGVDS